MNTKQFSIFYLPITHMLLVVTATLCITIFATLFHYLHILTISYVLLASIALYKKNNFLIISTLCLLIFSLIAISRINLQHAQYNAHHNWLNKIVTIEGVIVSINTSSLTKQQTTLIVSTTNIQNNKKQSLCAKKTISLFLPSRMCHNLTENQHVKINNVKLEQPPYSSDYQRYLIKETIWAIAHCHNQSIEITKEADPSLQKTCLDIIDNVLPPSASSLFYPLFLGKKEKNMQSLDIQHQSVYWGAAHHMARSGIHLGVLFGLLMLFFHYVSIAHWFRYIIIVITLLLYAYISVSSISFLRALCMILLQILCKFFKQIPSTLHILTITTIAVLLHNPMQLLFLDFQLSFGITYILIWLFLVKNSKTVDFS